MGKVSHFVVQTARHYRIQTDQNVKRQHYLWAIQTTCLQKTPHLSGVASCTTLRQDICVRLNCSRACKPNLSPPCRETSPRILSRIHQCLLVWLLTNSGDRLVGTGIHLHRHSDREQKAMVYTVKVIRRVSFLLSDSVTN